MSESYFYDGYRVLTHNCLYNFVVGERGNGKTYWFKEWSIRDFLKTGNQFVYVRRYKDEIKESTPTFFDDIREKFPDHDFEVKGKRFYIDKKVAGFSVELSTAKKIKSVAYPKVNKMCFDEFLIEKGNIRYIPNEIEHFLNLYETIARPGSDHMDVICFFMANAITWTNPYFLYFDIEKPTKVDKNGKAIWKNGEVLIELTESKAFRQKKLQTRFGSIIKGTKYASYSIDNQFILDSDTFIEKKGEKARYYFTFIYDGNSFGVWFDGQEGKMWVSEDVDPYYTKKYAIKMKDHKPNTIFIKNLSRASPLKIFQEYYKEGKVYFEDINIKNITYEVIKTCMV